MKTRVFLVVGFCFLVAATTRAQATASRDFEDNHGSPGCNPPGNIPPGESGRMKYKARLQGLPGINTNDIPMTSCEEGRSVAEKGLVGICEEAVKVGYDCRFLKGFDLIVGCPNFVDPADPNFMDGLPVTVKCLIDSKGFEVAIPSDAAVPQKFTVDGVATVLLSVSHNTNVKGQKVSTDLLPNLLFALAPTGDDGPLTITFNTTAPGTQPEVSFNTTGMSQQEIHEKMGSELKALGVTNAQGLDDIGWALEFSHAGSFADGRFVLAPGIQMLNGIGVNSIDITSPREIEAENALKPALKGVPAVSTWSIAIFIGLLLLAGSWFLRRGFLTMKRS